MDWAVGIFTVLMVVGGAFLFAMTVVGGWETPAQTKTNRAREENKVTDYRAALVKQAREAEKRSAGKPDGLSWDEWLHAAAMRLMFHWPNITYDAAREMIRDYMEDVATFPDPAFDWSLASASDTADEYMREYGESYGANQ